MSGVVTSLEATAPELRDALDAEAQDFHGLSVAIESVCRDLEAAVDALRDSQDTLDSWGASTARIAASGDTLGERIATAVRDDALPLAVGTCRRASGALSSGDIEAAGMELTATATAFWVGHRSVHDALGCLHFSAVMAHYGGKAAVEYYSRQGLEVPTCPPASAR